jgi:3-dehydroquinate synthase
VLSQDDSAVGVKNGINAFGKKNFVGSFAPPHAVLNDYELLLTLHDRDWRAGISEAVKVALLKDAAFFAWIEHHARDLADRSLTAMAHLIHRSAELHLNHIATSGDPFELGSSRPLDFGHWAAHKLEQLSHHELRHGEAVAIGIALDSTYSYLTGSLPHADWRRIVELFERVELPIWHPDMATPGSGGRPAVLAGLEEFREHLGGRLTVMLLERIGSGFDVHELDEAVLLEASDLLRRRVEGGDLSWQPTPAPARSLSVS